MALSNRTWLIYLLLVVRTVLFAAGPVGYVALVQNGADPYTTIAYILLTGGLITAFLHVAGIYKEPDRSMKEVTSSNIAMMLVMAAVVAGLYITYAISIEREAIIETTIMARLSAVLMIPLGVILLESKIVSWTKLVIGYTSIFAGVAVYKWPDLEHLVGAGGFGILLGLMIACFGAFFDTFGTYLSKYSKLPVPLTTGISMAIGGVALLVCIKVLLPATIMLPSMITFVGAATLGFLTIGLPGLIASISSRILNQPILVTVSTFAGLIFTAALAYYLYNEDVRIIPLGVMAILLVLGLALINQAEEKKKEN